MGYDAGNDKAKDDNDDKDDKKEDENSSRLCKIYCTYDDHRG